MFQEECDNDIGSNTKIFGRSYASWSCMNVFYQSTKTTNKQTNKQTNNETKTKNNLKQQLLHFRAYTCPQISLFTLVLFYRCYLIFGLLWSCKFADTSSVFMLHPLCMAGIVHYLGHLAGWNCRGRDRHQNLLTVGNCRESDVHFWKGWL